MSFREALGAKVSSPDKIGLQKIHENSPILNKQKADTLHYMITKLLWVSKMGITVIEPEISFLCTMFVKSTVEDKVKMKCVLQFLKQTINDNRLMGTDNPS